jgi:tetratricopeptide (TPR) repeat protein
MKTDMLNVLITAFAALVSFISLWTTFYTIYRGKYEQQRAVRNQLTDVLKQIAEVRIEFVKQSHQSAQQEFQYFQNVIAPELGQQLMSLLGQAKYLVEQDVIRNSITSVEYNTLAITSAQYGQLCWAEEYYRKSIDACKNDYYYKALAIKSFAVFLFFQHRMEEARTLFKQSIDMLQTNNDVFHSAKGMIYTIWAWCEKNMFERYGYVSPIPSALLFEYASKELSQISIDAQRHMAMNSLRSVVMDNISPLGSPTPATSNMPNAPYNQQTVSIHPFWQTTHTGPHTPIPQSNAAIA